MIFMHKWVWQEYNDNSKKKSTIQWIEIFSKNIYVMGDKETELFYNLNLDIL